MEIINRYSNVISISKKTKLNPKFFSRKTFIFYQRKNNKVGKKWSIRLTDRDTFSMWSQRGSRCYQEIVFLTISSLPPPHPPRVAKRVPLRVVSYVNVHPSVCPSVYRSSLGNAKFTAAITGLIFFVLSLNHVCSSPCSVPPLKYTLLRAPRQQRASYTSWGFPSCKTICSARASALNTREWIPVSLHFLRWFAAVNDKSNLVPRTTVTSPF